MSAEMGKERSDSEGPCSEKGVGPHECVEITHDEELELAVASSVNEKALIRKIDWRLVPWLSLLYCLNFLDRSNIGNARLYHMEADLHITDTQYLIALTTFFFPYALFEMPSNIVLKRFKPSRWLPCLMVVWGIIMGLHGLIHNYGGLVVLRFLLGLFEAGLVPGILFYLSCWYKRSELGFRVALFSSAGTVSGAFGGLLAAAIANMDGIGGKPAWAWIFIVEGLVTILISVISFWIVQDFPGTAKFLTDDERTVIVSRLQGDQQFSAGGENFRKKYIWQCLTDKKSWIGVGIFMGLDGPLFAFSLFTPTIINEVAHQYTRKGFQATASNLLSVPVYAWAGIMTCVVNLYADRMGQRAYVNIALFSTGLVGYIILLISRNASLSYFAVYLAAAGIYPTIPNSIAWVSSNTEGAYKRSALLGMVLGCGNINGAVASNVYRAKDTPWYPLGHGIVLTYIAIGWIMSVVMRLVLKAENDKRARGECDEVIREGLLGSGEKGRDIYESVEAARRDKGDNWSGFRYTL